VGTFILAAFKIDTTAHEFHQAFRDGQAETSSGGHLAGLRQLAEFAEDGVVLVCRYTPAGIGNTDVQMG